MSAFVLPKRHIDCLVATAIDGPRHGNCRNWEVSWFAQSIRGKTLAEISALRREARAETADQLGQLLTDEMLRSVRYRYDDADSSGMIPDWARFPYTFPIFTTPTLTVAEAAQALHSYEYQSCECPDFEDSEAYRFCLALAWTLPTALPDYAEADWVIDGPEECPPPPPPAPLPPDDSPPTIHRAEAIARIKAGLESRSGRKWSVTGGRGTGYGWLRISSPPKRRQQYGMSCSDRETLTRLLGLSFPVHEQGESVGASQDYYREYIDRAEGRTPAKIAEPYWD